MFSRLLSEQSRMNIRVLVGLFATAITCGIAAADEANMPQSGVTIDETRELKLRTTLTYPCVSMQTESAYIIVSTGMVESYAAVKPPEVVGLNNMRAAQLLKLLSTAKDPSGCQTITRSAARDVSYLFMHALLRSEASVIPIGKNEAVERVSVRFLAESRASGHIHFLLPDGRPLMDLLWWIS